MGKLAGKVAVITGGNSGIGLATAQSFIEEGAQVVIVGRNVQSVNETVNQLGEKAFGVRADVAKLEDLDTLYETVQKEFGRLDILVVNAGVAPMRPIGLVDEEYFDRIYDINVKGAFFTAQKALPLLQDSGSIIFVTSVGNVKGMAPLSVYVSSKAAVRSLTRSFAAELVDRNIRVNAISPGPIATPIFGKMEIPAEVQEQFAQTIESSVPMKRSGEPDEMAKAIVFLASDDASFILGAELVADGGMTQL